MLIFSANMNIKAALADGYEKNISEIALFAYDNRSQINWIKCEGQLLYKYDEQETLFEIIGHLFGGSNDTFRVPDLRSKKPFAEMPYYIAYKGESPDNNHPDQANRYLGEIALLRTDTDYLPQGWIPCDGRFLSIAEHEDLFNLIGTSFGWDGSTVFGIPDLRGKTPFGDDANYAYYIYTGSNAVFPSNTFNEEVLGQVRLFSYDTVELYLRRLV